VKNILQKLKGMKNKMLASLVGVGAVVAATVVAHAEDAVAETNALTFNFEASEMFSWTNMMLEAMMPVVYITLGISLCFIIVGALKSAFRG
jgi:hypothetical protein